MLLYAVDLAAESGQKCRVFDVYPVRGGDRSVDILLNSNADRCITIVFLNCEVAQLKSCAGRYSWNESVQW